MNRTVCDCRECVACCERQPGPLGTGDLERIQAHLGLTAEETLPLFVASPGSLVMDRRTGQTRRIGSITPARKEDGSCIFLREGRCTIHPVAPFGCAYFDVHMDAETAAPRSLALARMMDEPVYQAVRRLLEEVR